MRAAERAPLGTSPKCDSEATPTGSDDFPLHTAASLAVVYLLGYFGWHWSYVLVIFWLLVTADGRQQRRQWAVLQREALAAAAASSGTESVTWLNELLRAVWPMYEAPLARYTVSHLQPFIDRRKPTNLGIKSLRIREFSFGGVDPRRTDRRHRLAPILLDKVQMVSKSAEAVPGSRDPRPQRVRYVLLADLRWHAGAEPALTMEVSLGPQFLSLVSVDAEVRDLILSGTLRIEIDWVRPYPWLGTCYLSFVKTPAIDFKLSLGGSPDVMHLAPPLRNYLKSMLDQTIRDTMVGNNRLKIPLSEWYGEGGNPTTPTSTVTAAEMAAPYAPPTPYMGTPSSYRAAGSLARMSLSGGARCGMSREASFCAPTANGMLPPMSRDDSFATPPSSNPTPQPRRRRASDDSELPSVLRANASQTEAQKSGDQLAAAISRAVASRLEKAADSRREAQRQADGAANRGGRGDGTRPPAGCSGSGERDSSSTGWSRERDGDAHSETVDNAASAVVAAASEARKRNHAADSERERNTRAAFGRLAGGDGAAADGDRGGGDGGGGRRNGSLAASRAPVARDSQRSQPLSLPPSPRMGRLAAPYHDPMDFDLSDLSTGGRGSAAGRSDPSLSIDVASGMGVADGGLGSTVDEFPPTRFLGSSPARAPAGFMTSDEFFGDSGLANGPAARAAGSVQRTLLPPVPQPQPSASSMFTVNTVSASPAFEAPSRVDSVDFLGPPLSALPHNLGARAAAAQSVASSSDGELTRHLPRRDALAPPSPLLPALTSEPPHRLSMLAFGSALDPELEYDGNEEDEAASVDHAEAVARAPGTNGAADGHIGGLRAALMSAPLGQWAVAQWERRMQRDAMASAAEAASAAAAARSAAIASGAVAELLVEVLHATGLAAPNLAEEIAPNLAPTFVFGLAVGDESELLVRGAPINASAAKAHAAPNARPGAPKAVTTRLEVKQQWRLAVHDSLTQRLRLRVLVKEIAQELTILGDAEMPLSDLRLNMPANRAVVLPIAGRRDPALLHLRVTYSLLAVDE